MTLFNYLALDEEVRGFVQERASTIYEHLAQIGHDVMTIGYDLLEAKSSMPTEHFKWWVQVECTFSYPTALRYMRIAKRLGGKERLFSQPITVLNELASPSTPDAIIEAVANGTLEPTLPLIREAKYLSKIHALEGLLKTPESPVLSGASSSQLE